ncbi:TPA: sugar-binding transcriptional regulator [Streptococcus agalactiae]
MKLERQKLLAKVAYLYYMEGKSQSEIANELGIYRTTISRMLAKAREEGLVRIEISDFNPEIFQLESYFKSKYHLKDVEIVSSRKDSDTSEIEKDLAHVAAAMIRKKIKENDKVGIAWGRTLSKVVEAMRPHPVSQVSFVPLAGGPSHINARYHVNTLVYEMSRRFQGSCTFINATLVQENANLAKGILTSKYFEGLMDNWEKLDVAIVGVGGKPKSNEQQWLDLLNQDDFQCLDEEAAVGEITCRFFNHSGDPVNQHLAKRTIGITLEQLQKVPNRIAVAHGNYKAAALLAVLKKGYINHLVTDFSTALNILRLDKDTFVDTIYQKS